MLMQRYKDGRFESFWTGVFTTYVLTNLITSKCRVYLLSSDSAIMFVTNVGRGKTHKSYT